MARRKKITQSVQGPEQRKIDVRTASSIFKLDRYKTFGAIKKFSSENKTEKEWQQEFIKTRMISK